MKNYNNSLNIYEAKYDEIKQAIKQEYKHREHTDCYGNKMTIKDWEEINKNLKNDLKEMGVRNAGCFYNPNNQRVYIKQKFWIENLHLWEQLSKEQQREEANIYGSRKLARKAWNEEKECSSLEYSVATGTDYYDQDGEYFSVPAW